MPAGDTGQNREGINRGIENAYIKTAENSASIRHHNQSGVGSLDLIYYNFHYYLGLLFDLTCDRTEMVDEGEAIKPLEEWLEMPTHRNDRELHERCNTGRKLFRDYSKALNRRGLLNLPSS